MTQQNKIFVSGMKVDTPSPKAPKWVLANVAIKVPELIIFLKEHQNNAGWVNIDLKVGQSGQAYAELNTWKPTKNTQDNPELDEMVEEIKKPIIDPATGNDVSEQPF